MSLNLWADILEKNFEENDIIIIPSQNKYSMIDLAEFFDTFKIPVFLIFDNDKSTTDKEEKPNKNNKKWLLEFVGEKREVLEMTIPKTEVGRNFCVFDPNYESVLEREDSVTLT